MPDILSNEEIDALLDAADYGGIGIRELKDGECTPLDLGPAVKACNKAGWSVYDPEDIWRAYEAMQATAERLKSKYEEAARQLDALKDALKDYPEMLL